MNVRCEKADGSQNPVIKGGLPHASIEIIQSVIPLPTRNACNYRSADVLDRLYRSKTTHQVTTKTHPSCCNPTVTIWETAQEIYGQRGVLFPPTVSGSRGVHIRRNHLVICRDRFLDLWQRGLSAHLRNVVSIKSGYLVVIPPVCTWEYFRLGFLPGQASSNWFTFSIIWNWLRTLKFVICGRAR